MKLRWALGVFAGIILALLAFYPQWNLERIRGAEFNGVFATCDLDEMAYTAYLQALIDGRPRKNDPYTGRDHRVHDQQSESLFSIQFFPAYLAAIPARIVGYSASEMMPVLSVISGFLTALALFWLIRSITGDDLFSFAGTLTVMTASAAVIGIGAINGLFDGGVAYPFFPYMRRYIPSLAFPFLFAFFACLWNGLNSEDRTRQVLFGISAAVCFSALVFSYFYIWTAAAGVFGCLCVSVLLLGGKERRQDTVFLLLTGALCALTLIPYAILLSDRNKLMDKAQLLVITRQLDLFRGVEIIGYCVIVFAAIILWRKRGEQAQRKLSFVIALAASPAVVFNQQLVTGRSLQPFHYEFYVINYVVLLAAVLLFSMTWKWLSERSRNAASAAAIILSVLAIAWGYFEASETTRFWDQVNVRRDEAMPVNLRLRELAEDGSTGSTLNLESLQADSQPTVAPQAVLWARHQHTFAGLESWEENKLRYFQLLYFSDRDAEWLRQSLTACRDIEACMALFGWDRFNARLSANARPLTKIEIDEEVRRFAEFSDLFTKDQALNLELSYLVTYVDDESQFKNVDRWFERGMGEVLGKYVLYPLSVRSQ
ncbi:MAG: hypothetical protein WBD22_13925 [Pyrinomonadaceae bacterium]